MVSEVELIEVAITADMTGVPAAEVVKVLLGDVAEMLLAFAETTSKLYVELAVRPVKVTECTVVNELFSGEEEP